MSFDTIRIADTNYRANLSANPVHYYDATPDADTRLYVDAHNPRLIERIAFFDAAIEDGEPRFPWGYQPCFCEDGETVHDTLMRYVREFRQESVDLLHAAQTAWYEAEKPTPADLSFSGTTLQEMLDSGQLRGIL